MILKAILPFDDLSGVLDAQHRSALATCIGGRWARASVISLLFCLLLLRCSSLIVWVNVCAQIGVLWLSADVALLLILRNRPGLVVGSAAHIALLGKALLLLLWNLLLPLRWSSVLVCTYLLLLLLLRILGSLLSKSLLVSSIEARLVIELVHAVDIAHFGVYIALGWLHLLRWWSFLSILTFLALLCCWVSIIWRLLLLIWACVHLNLLVDLDWSIANSEAVTHSQGTIRLISSASILLLIEAHLIVERAIYLEFDCAWWLIGCGRRKLGGNVHWVHCFFQGINLLQVSTFRRLLGGRLALVASTDGLWVALYNHWLERWDLLLIFIDVGRGWGDIVVDHTDTDLGMGHRIVCCASNWLWFLRLLGGIVFMHLSIVLDDLGSPLVLGQIIVDGNDLMWSGLVLWSSIGGSCDLLIVRQIVADLILHNHFLERMRVDALLLVITKDHSSCSFALGSWDVGNCLLDLLVGLLNSELFNAVAVDVELLVTEFVLGVAFTSRDNGIEIKYTFIRSFQIHHVVSVGVEAGSVFLWAALSLLGLVSRREL